MITDKENISVGSPAAKKLRTEGTPTTTVEAASAIRIAATNVAPLPTLNDLTALVHGRVGAGKVRHGQPVDSFIVVLHDSASRHLAKILDGVIESQEATCVPIFAADVSGGAGWSMETALAVLTAGQDPSVEIPPALPILFLFTTYAAEPPAEGPSPCQAPRLVAAKPIESNMHIHSQSLLQPVLSIRHLEVRLGRDLASAAAAVSTMAAPSRSFSLLYFGASWCPPCMNILKALPKLLADKERPPSIHLCVKADMDLAQPLFDVFAVETIPTFIVLDNAQLCEEDGRYCLTELCKETATADADGTPGAAEKKMVRRLKAAAVVGRIQNSQEATIEAFLQKHCGTLSFTLDEDF